VGLCTKSVFCRGYFSRKGAKAQSAAAFSEVFFVFLRLAQEIFLPPMRLKFFAKPHNWAKLGKNTRANDESKDADLPNGLIKSRSGKRGQRKHSFG